MLLLSGIVHSGVWAPYDYDLPGNGPFGGIIHPGFVDLVDGAPVRLYQVAKTAVLNNNYLFKKMLEIPGIGAYYCDGNISSFQHTRRYPPWTGFRSAQG